jgi:uncharacterized membrane protein YoaK (UPF0700 family)
LRRSPAQEVVRMSHAIPTITAPRSVGALLGFVAGFVDICAFLGLFHIFVAQVTGSFVFASTWLIIHHGELLMMLAIPVFFLACSLATAVAVAVAPYGRPFVAVLGLECALLALMLLLMVTVPLNNMNTPGTIATALAGISAMGVQSAMVRLFMRHMPSANVMTTNTTQLGIDLTLVLLSRIRKTADGAAHEQERAARERIAHHWPVMASFVLGTVIGALGYQSMAGAALVVPLAGVCGLLIWIMRTDRDSVRA